MALRNMSIRQIRKELARREKGAAKLVKKRDKLQSQLADLVADLADLGVEGAAGTGGGGKRRGRPPGSKNKVKPGRKPGPKAKGGRKGKAKLGRPKGSKNRKPGAPKGKRAKRAKNSMSLVEAVLKSVSVGSKTSPAEAAEGAKKVGYKSNSPNFGMMTANTLAKDKRFKRLERGMYQRVA